MSSPSLALAFATIERPQVVQRLVTSVRHHCGNMPIYVADQSHQLDAMRGFYAAHNVHVIRMPFDCGVTIARNRLVREVQEDYFVLCDDDFIIGRKTDFADALNMLAACPELAVIGGRLHDFDGVEEWVRNWELFLQHDRKNKILFSIPIYHLAPKIREVGKARIFLCDAVLNFAVFRRAVFDAGVRWDERFKSNGEHEDFYLHLKTNTPFQVAYLPTMVAYHHHPEDFRAYRSQLRDRDKGWKQFFEKWDIEQHVELGLGVRTIDAAGTVIDAGDTRSRFFFNPGLSLHRELPVEDAMVVGDGGVLSAVGLLDEAGNRLGGAATTGTLLIDPSSRRLIAAPPDPFLRQAGSAGPPVVEDMPDRYTLETSDAGRVVVDVPDDLHFRYDSTLRPAADFFLWYFRHGTPASSTGAHDRLSTAVRWTASNGQIVVWRSRRIFLDTGRTGYWRPVLLDVPLLPHGCIWLRFDVVTDGGSSPDPIVTGFLFGSGRPPDASGRQVAPPDSDVIAVSRLFNDGAISGIRGERLDVIGRDCPERLAALQAGSFGRRLLRRDDIAELDMLFFVEWACFGRALVSARLPPAELPAPVSVALPAAIPAGSRGRVYGWGSRAGFVALRLTETHRPPRP